jgi:hypothetical protein
MEASKHDDRPRALRQKEKEQSRKRKRKEENAEDGFVHRNVGKIFIATTYI